MSPYLSKFRAFAVVFVSLAFLAGVCGCANEEPPQPASSPVVQRAAPPKEAPPPAVAEQDKKPEAPAVSGYNPEGKRDPFVSFAKSEAERRADDRSLLPPLQRYELGELKMVGVIWGGREAKALVEDAEGRGYTVSVGERIGRSDGVVTRITEGEIIIREEFPGVGGRRITKENTLQLISAGGTQ